MSGPRAAEVLAALQLADSFFPTGMYAHSCGLEGMVRRGWVRTAEDVEELVRNQFTWSVVPGDGVALLNAYRAAALGDLGTLIAVDRLLYSLKLPAELRAASCQAGRRLLDETAPLTSGPVHASYRAEVERHQTPGTGAVALGVVGWALDIPEEWALLMFCHSYAVGVLSAAMRLLRLTHSQAQGILWGLHSLVADLVNEVKDRTWQEMTSFTPQLDIAAMGHESDDLRMFAS
jgi:urease accessory protein